MVKVAIAGPGRESFRQQTDPLPQTNTERMIELAREIIDALLATGKHEIIILGRKVFNHHRSLLGPQSRSDEADLD
jgi:hypothetical protein